MGRGAMSFKLKDKDRGWRALQAFAKKVAAKQATVHIGVIDDGSRDGGDLTNAELAAIHEFGAPGANIPERSFIRSTFDTNQAKYRDLLKRLGKAVLLKRQSVVDALGILGATMAADIKKRVTSGPHIPPPLAAATARRKGSDRPLVDTGQMINAVTWKVVSR